MLKQLSSWLKLALFIVIPIVILINQSLPKTQFLDPVSTFSPDLSYFPKPSPTPKVKPSPSNNSGANTPETTETVEKIYPANAEPSPSPQPQFSSEEIHGFMEKYSNEYGTDINIIRHIAVCESGFNPKAQNLSYAGLFQFSPNSWQHYRGLMSEDGNKDLRLHAQEAVKTAAYVLSINQAYIWPNCVPN